MHSSGKRPKEEGTKKDEGAEEDSEFEFEEDEEKDDDQVAAEAKCAGTLSIGLRARSRQRANVAMARRVAAGNPACVSGVHSLAGASACKAKKRCK